jgi:hypothetical protein
MARPRILPRDPEVAKLLRKRRCDSKYDEKYIEQLRSGIRYKHGLSVIELCHRWRISETTFRRWLTEYPDFADAFEMSKADYAAYWHEINKASAKGEIKGNAGQIIFALTNVDGINWSNKVDVHNTSAEEVKRLVIEVLPTKQQVIEHIPDAEFVDAEKDD